MPVPKNLNYDMWLGSTPVVPYTEKRVHPQSGYDRPGWLRCEQFGAGMITGWGAHHIDSAHWGMDTEYTGPDRGLGLGGVPDEGPVGRPRSVPDRGDLRQRRAHDRQRRLPERHQVHRHATAGSSSRAATRPSPPAIPSSKLKDAQALGGERSEDHHVGDRPGRDPPVREQGSSRQLAGLHPVAPAADRAGRSRAPRLLGLPAPPHGDEGQAQAVLGSAEGAIQERRRGERACCRGRSARRTSFHRVAFAFFTPLTEL